MTSRIMVNGRARWRSRDWPRAPRSFVKARQLDGSIDMVPEDGNARDREGRLLDTVTPVPEARRPFEAGTAWHDPEEDVVYRLVQRLNPLDGWATTEFWGNRWRCRHQLILSLVRAGLLDAARVPNSQIRRYRCRDEQAVLASKEWAAYKHRYGFGRDKK